MGNTNTKESRSDYPEGFSDGRERRFDMGDSRGILGDPRLQHGRTERSFLSIGNGSSSRNRDRPDAPFEHRETKQEREARKLERERVLRAQERERSIREEHVDGGYLVTMGTYVGTEDFNKAVVRQLQVERKLAPFWRGLNDWSSSWAEHQLIAVARGLPLPAADAPPDPELLPRPPPPSSDFLAGPSLSNLTVEMGPRTLSTASDVSGSGTNSALPSPSTAGPLKGSIKPRARALAAALSVGSRNASSTDLGPKEINLPHDPFVNGQPLEVYLYKDADECPICFLTYPPYLNRTRCCDQPICSECFVQIKRSDPHLPEHHPDGQARNPNEGLSAEDSPDMLISEPSACPYCQVPEFGVTYEPPPFRRGLAIAPTASSTAASNTAMSSQSSLSSTLIPGTATTGRRRAHSLSVNAPNVITTDRIRPDWATKLAAARAHQARRAAAATALHTAAFLIGGNESRSRIRTGRFGRRNTGSSGGTTTPGGQNAGTDAPEGQDPAERTPSRNPDGTRRSRMEELEDMMLREAVRLSLATEEERKRKVEKALQKEAKKREKEREKAERKALKKQGKDPYGGGLSGASGSSLSLGLGRKRGNSAASNLRLEATMQAASQSSRGPDAPDHDKKAESAGDKGKWVDRGPQSQSGATEATSSTSLPIPASSPRGGSHLRHMSNASSIGSSSADSPSGSYPGQGLAGADANATKRQSMGNRSDSGDGETESEPMLNFRSLAEIVGVNIDDGSVINQAETAEGTTSSLPQVEEEKEEPGAEHIERSLRVETSDMSKESTSNASEAANSSRNIPPFLDTPELTITPDTPIVEDGAEDKQLGQSSVLEHEATQTTH
ncbi:hypothetical protein ACSS6W_002896 [Trichoderma asperelloides]|uniref:Protein SIP5 n=1 Tax=Trichoderma asperellum TaxID=101201 RepID=A0A6V8QS74_TRIAP|nr:protein SIP5 [Trichoderma asperellum]